LKVPKSELAALDRKITAELAPKHDETADGEEIKPTAACHQPQTRKSRWSQNLNFVIDL